MEAQMRQAIEQAAQQLIGELQGRSLIAPLTIIQGAVMPYQGALYKDIASFRNDWLRVQIWDDGLLIDEQPTLWIGFGAKDDPTLETLLNDCGSEFPDPKQIRSDQEWQDHFGTASKEVAEQPTVVAYDEWRGFGVYRRWGDAGLQAASDFIEQVLRSLPEFGEKELELRKLETEFSDNVIEQLIGEINNNPNLSETEKEAVIKIRLTQGPFRAVLDRIWNNQCAVLGYSTRGLLRASHIKPWSHSRHSENGKYEQCDPNNGLLLAAHLDALFDTGLISFRDDGSMMISAKIKDDPKQLNLGENLRKKPSEDMKTYLKYHREAIFKSPEA